MDQKRPAEIENAQQLLKRQKTAQYTQNEDLRNRYTIAWICALHIELTAAQAMLDRTHDSLPRQPNDSNTYILGNIQHHNIVIACLPIAEYGVVNAALVLSNLRRTFPNVTKGLMVGIGGGVPSKVPDIRLGDVVVGIRVMQHDFGKLKRGEMERTGQPKIPDYGLRTAVTNVRSQHNRDQSTRIPIILQEKLEANCDYSRPETCDRLFRASYSHDERHVSCSECDSSMLEPRKERSNNVPFIHYGGIASGSTVMKDAVSRDAFASSLDVICFEMEAAGLMDILPCLPIRGICDYSDSHKSKEWQRYAAATAAAYATEFLENLPADEQVEYSVDSSVNMEQVEVVDRRRQLLESLNFDQIDDRKASIGKAYRKTCEWFLQHPDYIAWQDPARDHNGFLWIRGKPGSGKSTFMKFLYLKEKNRQPGKQTALVASFFFNARGDYLERTVSGMYRSLLLQLLEGFPDLQQVLEDPDVVPRNLKGCPNLNILKDLFRSAILSLGRRVFTCFIDALDECDEQQVMDLVDFFDDLAEDAKDQNIRLYVCFSSRPYPYITVRQGTELTLEQLDGHAEDLQKYIRSHLSVRDATLVNEMQESILKKAAGVFLWVVLVVGILNRENDRGRLTMKQRLAEVPEGLSELFKDILRRDSNNMEQLLLCVLWILLAKRPLTPAEYYHAIWSGLNLEGLSDHELPPVTSSDADECFLRTVVSSSKGLAEISGTKNSRVQFIHESVRDFLVKDRGLYQLWPDLDSDWESKGHQRLRNCCRFYIGQYLDHLKASDQARDPSGDESESDATIQNPSLSRSDPVLTEEVSHGWKFLEYSAQNILRHAESAADVICQRDFLNLFPVSKWVKISNQFEKFRARRFGSQATLLYIVAEQGLSELIRIRLEEEADVFVPTERYRYAFFAAIASGNKDAVAAVLGLTSMVLDTTDIMDGLTCKRDLEVSGHTPLSWAAAGNHLGLVRHLVQRGDNIDEQDGKKLTPLMRAFHKGQLETVLFLIENGAELSLASLHGHKAFDHALLNCNATVRGVRLNKGEVTAFFFHVLCSEQKHDGAVYLIEKGALDIHAAFADFKPLHSALKYNSLAAMQLLIEKGTDIEAMNSYKETPLHLASKQDSIKAIQLLIEKGANIEATNSYEETPLHLASKWDNLEAMQLLIEKGANIEATNSYKETPLHLASKQDSLKATVYSS